MCYLCNYSNPCYFPSCFLKSWGASLVFLVLLNIFLTFHLMLSQIMCQFCCYSVVSCYWSRSFLQTLLRKWKILRDKHWRNVSLKNEILSRQVWLSGFHSLKWHNFLSVYRLVEILLSSEFGTQLILVRHECFMLWMLDELFNNDKYNAILLCIQYKYIHIHFILNIRLLGNLWTEFNNEYLFKNIQTKQYYYQRNGKSVHKFYQLIQWQ